MMTQGIDPQLDISDINHIRDVYEHCNQLAIPERHPYVGELVYTAFSGSHQDAINKGMKAIKDTDGKLWEVPYLPIDPEDVGRSYEAIIRINSQSGKGGIAYILQADYGLNLPRNLQIEFRKVIQDITDKEGIELTSKRIYDEFMATYVNLEHPRLRFISHTSEPDPKDKELRIVHADMVDGNEPKNLQGSGTGPIDGFVDALSKEFGMDISVTDYSEHSVSQGANAAAICYMELKIDGDPVFGVGINTNIVTASLEAIVSGVNIALAKRG